MNSSCPDKQIEQLLKNLPEIVQFVEDSLNNNCNNNWQAKKLAWSSSTAYEHFEYMYKMTKYSKVSFW